MNYNIVDLLVIRVACRLVNQKIDMRFISISIESDSTNAVSWVSGQNKKSWRLLYLFSKIDSFLSDTNRSIVRVKESATQMLIN